MGLLGTLKEFARGTSIHGLAFIAESGSSGFKRATWAVLFFGFTIYALMQLLTAADCKFKFFAI